MRIVRYRILEFTWTQTWTSPETHSDRKQYPSIVHVSTHTLYILLPNDEFTCFVCGGQIIFIEL